MLSVGIDDSSRCLHSNLYEEKIQSNVGHSECRKSLFLSVRYGFVWRDILTDWSMYVLF